MDETLNLTCCSHNAQEVDLAIKKVFKAQQGEYWNFYRDILDLSWISNPDTSPSQHKIKYIIWEPRNRPLKAILITNRKDGGDTIINNLSRLFKMELVKAFITNDSAQYPYYNFQYFKNGKELRRVYVMLDTDKWVFFQSGDRLRFEDESAYKNRIVRERLDQRQILLYLNSLGWNLQDDASWASNALAFYGEQLKFKDRAYGSAQGI